MKAYGCYNLKCLKFFFAIINQRVSYNIGFSSDTMKYLWEAIKGVMINS